MNHLTQNTQYSATKNNKFWHIVTLLLLAFAVLARIYFYYKHKDLWVDEAAIVFSVYGVPLKDIFFQPLYDLQAAPLGFLLVSKGLGAAFGYSEYVLYFMPFVCGVGILILSILIGRKILGYFGGFLLLLFCVGAQNLLYYTTEFKQYGIEAFCSFLLLYLYIKASEKENLNALKGLYIASIVCIIFSNTAIFITMALCTGIFYQNRHNLMIFFKQNLAWLLSIAIFFALYYFLYLKFQRVEGFYAAWAHSFLPHSLSAYPQFMESFFSMLSQFTSLTGKHMWIYMLLWLVGSYVTFKVRRDIFIICASAMFIYMALSFFRIYPFGQGGLVGSRLSLWMSPIFYLPCCYAFYFFMQKHKILKNLIHIVLVALCYLVLARYADFYTYGHRVQQTHALIKQMHKDYKEGDVILVSSSMKNTYKYYSFLDSVSYPYEIFSGDLQALEALLMKTNAKTIYLLSFHHNKGVEELKNLGLKFDKNVVFIQDDGEWGPFLMEINKNKND